MEELLGESAHGPIIVYTIDRRRSDAILLSSDGIDDLPLPGLKADVLSERITTFHQALETARDRQANSDQRLAAQATLNGILEWLWDTAAEPVLDKLGFRAPPEHGDPYPRVWWVPGGLLGLLPLHAAGYHREIPAPGTGRRTVMDRVASSYTPTIRALRHARGQHPTPPESTRALIVAMPTTPAAPPLRNVAAEAAALYKRLPRPELLMEGGATPPMVAGTPTRENVVTRLERCSIAHFACHGFSDPADPSRSQLLLHDPSDPLTVASLAPVNLERADLAYLSACQTAVNSAANLLDEPFPRRSLPAGRIPRVIGTLWGIDDGISVRIADAFYASLDGSAGLAASTAAYSLHSAVRNERDTLFRSPSLWAAYMHAGA